MPVRASVVERDLKNILEGEVLSDDTTREAYSTAACMYRIRPLCVVIPKTTEDVQATLRYASEYEIPIIPRGGATSLAGQAVGFGIVLDLATSVNQILETHPQNGWVRVQPGIVLDQLNAHLLPYQKFFPPDPASSNQCVIGGMIGTNAAGAHGISYGATKDYVLSLKVALSDGEIVEFHSAANGHPSAGAVSARVRSINERLDELLRPKKRLIQSRYPKVQKNSSGYNLLDAIRNDQLDTAKILIGSEGTLAVVVEAKLKIQDLPKAKAAGLAYFRDYESMAEAVLASLHLNPAAIELIDKTLLDLARSRSPIVKKFIEDGTQAQLLFEFEGGSDEEANSQLEALRQLLVDQLRLAFKFRMNPESLGSFWEVRKEATHILEEVQSETKKASFIEDVTVPVSRLPEYLEGLTSLLRSCGISFSIYGHAGVGNVHCEPLMDLRKIEHRGLLNVLAREVFDLAISLGGTLSGEHGDGYVRTPFLERLYGPQVYDLFREVKKIFDPRGILNPGKIVGPQGESIAHDLKIDSS